MDAVWENEVEEPQERQDRGLLEIPDDDAFLLRLLKLRTARQNIQV